MNKIWAILDRETGEILETGRPVKGTEEKNASETEEKVDLNYSKFKENLSFTKFFHTVIPLAPHYVAYLVRLSHYLLKNTNALGIQHKNGKVRLFGKENIREVLGISRVALHNFLTEANKEGVIASGKFKLSGTEMECWIVNPAYMFNGVKIANTTVAIFQNDENFKAIIEQNLA